MSLWQRVIKSYTWQPDRILYFGIILVSLYFRLRWLVLFWPVKCSPLFVTWPKINTSVCSGAYRHAPTHMKNIQHSYLHCIDIGIGDGLIYIYMYRNLTVDKLTKPRAGFHNHGFTLSVNLNNCWTNFKLTHCVVLTNTTDVFCRLVCKLYILLL